MWLVRSSGPSALAKRRTVTQTDRSRSANAAYRPLGLHDVLLERRPRRVGAIHVLREEGRIVALAAVEVRGRLEHHLAHRRVRPAAGGQDVHRPDHVVLVGDPLRGEHGVDDQPRVHHRVDVRGADDPAQQGVLVPDAHVLRAVELAGGVLGADADDRLDRRVALQRLREPPAPVRRQAGDEDASGGHPSHTDRRRPIMSSTSSWMRPRISSAISCSSPRSSSVDSSRRSVRTGGRKRRRNLAGR